MAVIRVLLADDHRLFRQGVAEILREQPDLDVVGEVGDGEAAIAEIEHLQPDIVLMDVRMPRLNGVEASARISATLPKVRVIVLTAYRDDRIVFDAIRAGAAGYLLKDVDAADLVAAIRSVHAGQAHIDPGLARCVIEEFRRLGETQSHVDPPLQFLSSGEMDVLRLVAQGCENAEICAALSLAYSTVGNRLNAIFQKLHVNNRTQAALEALRRGWTTLD